MGENAISILHLSKSYGRVQALRDLNLSVQPGEIFGFLGPNGAGKTTTLAAVGSAKLALPHLELLVFMLFFAGLAVLLSQLLPSRGAATGLASAVLLASYVLYVLLELDDQLAGLEKFSPLHYIKAGYAIEGLNITWLLGLLWFALVFIALAAWRFNQRDLRVSGEGSWPRLR